RMEQIPILDVLRRHLSMIIILGVVAGLAGYGFSFLLTEHYVASALVLVRPQEAIKMDARKADKEFLDFPMGQSTSIETPSKTYIEIIKSPEMIANVVRRLGLDKEKETDSGVIPSFVRQTVDDLKQWLASSI